MPYVGISDGVHFSNNSLTHFSYRISYLCYWFFFSYVMMILWFTNSKRHEEQMTIPADVGFSTVRVAMNSLLLLG